MDAKVSDFRKDGDRTMMEAWARGMSAAAIYPNENYILLCQECGETENCKCFEEMGDTRINIYLGCPTWGTRNNNGEELK